MEVARLFSKVLVLLLFLANGATYGTATGGSSSSITVSSVNYTLLAFTTDATLTVSKAGLFDVMLVGGGGGGWYWCIYFPNRRFK
jgi:hypothetical protein